MLWNDIKKVKPLAYITGGFDGKKSDKVLVYTRFKEYHVAEMYEGVLDGNEYCEFFDGHDCEITNVIFWTEIDKPV